MIIQAFAARKAMPSNYTIGLEQHKNVILLETGYRVLGEDELRLGSCLITTIQVMAVFEVRGRGYESPLNLTTPHGTLKHEMGS